MLGGEEKYKDRVTTLLEPMGSFISYVGGAGAGQAAKVVNNLIMVITAENDVLRDEGEAYARKLTEAGVSVTSTRYISTIHDFVMLNALSDTPAAKGAIEQATDFLRNAFAR
jgi:acetyl esterase/lipase